jgi:hypothetical protein
MGGLSQPSVTHGKNVEHRAKLAVKLPEVGAVDWSVASIDWTAIFAALVKFLPLLLTIFGL